ncbi:MAG TPA: sulfite exporter TauE/SafE family protein [Methylomirabilota bacterium]|nr:sulfite exporter TauE/SafE family protein [Methylomirabilota bacterium]
MTPAFAVTLTALGFTGAFVSGLLGVGGAIVMIPLLYYVPPLLGVGALDMRGVAGVSMVQVLVASLLGAWSHGRHAAVHRRLAIVGGVAMALGTFAGALGSSRVSGYVLLAVFALMTTVALPLLLVPLSDERPDAQSPSVNLAAAAVALGLIGVGAGLVGSGGAFLTVPVLVTLLRLPMRLAIGTSLAVTGVSAVSGVIGKALGAQIPLGPTALVMLGSVLGAPMGSAVSRRAPVGLLRGMLAGVVMLVAIRLWWDLFGR